MSNDTQDHPVTSYLSSLVWDGTPRIDRWLIDCAGANDTQHICEVSRRVLIAAVRRARHPGCRLDQVLILKGPQGCGKSSALRVLAVQDAWFTDVFPLHTQGLVEATADKWIVELTDMPTSSTATLKVCLSRPQDTYRRTYETKASQIPRQFIVVGTTDKTDDYLHDSTGNRRFWPVSVQRFRLERLNAERDQLWAEAARAESLGEPIHFDPPEATALAS